MRRMRTITPTLNQINRITPLRLCLVTKDLKNQAFETYKPFLAQLVSGGVPSIQLRVKTTDVNEFEELAKEFQTYLFSFGEHRPKLIFNDFVESAAKLNADGVHIGQSDMSPKEARKILGPGPLIGLTVNNEDELEAANRLPSEWIDSVACTAVFPSRTKQCDNIWGLEGLKRFVKMSKHPVVGIGGINVNNAQAVIESGAIGIALVGALHQPNAHFIASDLMDKINSSLEVKNLCLKP